MEKWCLHASSFIFDRIIIKVSQVRFWAKSDHSYRSYLPLSDENFALLNLNIFEASWPIFIKFYV